MSKHSQQVLNNINNNELYIVTTTMSKSIELTVQIYVI